MTALRWKLLRDTLIPALLAAGLWAVMAFYRPVEIPPLWFDEGWSLTVARNWVETGQYARLLQGIPVSSQGMAQPFSSTGPIALSFLLFGVGAWQGRLPAMIFMALAFYLTFQLVRQLYGHKVAYLTLFALLFIAAPPVHPLIIGRQAIAEAPQIFYLVAGYSAFWAALNGKKFAIFAAVLCWGLALDSKGHTLPFWSVSLFVPIGVTILRKQWRNLRLFSAAWVGSLCVYFLVNGIESALFSDFPVYDAPMQGLYSVTAFVLAPNIRLSALVFLGISGLPTMIGLGYGVLRCWREARLPALPPAASYLQLALLSLAVSWSLWFFLFSISWGRYFFPVSYFGSIFVALGLAQLFRHATQLTAGQTKPRLLSRLPHYTFLLVVAYGMVMNIAFLRYQISLGNADALRIAAYIHQHIGADALIETYESELLFLIDNPVHYPPDQIQVELNRWLFLHQEVKIPYDPSQVDFRYLIVGPSCALWQLYTPLLEQEQFNPIFVAGRYTIYERVSGEEITR